MPPRSALITRVPGPSTTVGRSAALKSAFRVIGSSTVVGSLDHQQCPRAASPSQQISARPTNAPRGYSNSFPGALGTNGRGEARAWGRSAARLTIAWATKGASGSGGLGAASDERYRPDASARVQARRVPPGQIGWRLICPPAVACAFTRLHKRAAWPDRIESRRQCPASSATIERLADTDRRKRICGDCHRALRRRPRPIGASAMSPPIQSLAMVRGESECARPRLTGFLLGGTSAPLPSCSCECLFERHIATGADCAVCARRELIKAVDARASI